MADWAGEPGVFVVSLGRGGSYWGRQPIGCRLLVKEALYPHGTGRSLQALCLCPEVFVTGPAFPKASDFGQEAILIFVKKTLTLKPAAPYIWLGHGSCKETGRTSIFHIRN